MNAQAKPREPISDLRLQALIDEYTRRYVRLRSAREITLYDTVMALTELQTTRRVLAESRGAA